MFEQCDYCGQPSRHCYFDEDGFATCPDCHAMFTMGQEQPEYNEDEDEDDLDGNKAHLIYAHNSDIFDYAMFQTFLKDQR